MRLADSHIHLFPHGYSLDGQPALFGSGEVAAYEALRSIHGIECALAVGYEADGIDPRNNAYIRHLGATRSWLHTVAYVDAGAVPSADAVEALLDEGHCGIALYVMDAERAGNVLNWPRNIWDMLCSRRAIVSLNARPEAITMLGPVVQAAAGVPFLFAHLGLPGRLRTDTDGMQNRMAPMLALASLENAHVKISGLYAASDPPFAYPHTSVAPLIQDVLAAFGARRCLWGSDFSPALEFVSFPQTIAWIGSEETVSEELGLIMRGNLVRLLERPCI